MIRWRHDQQNLGMDVDTGNLPLGDDQRRLLEKTGRAIQQRTRGLPNPQLHVKVSHPPNASNFAYEVDMDMEIMGRTLTANGQGDELDHAIREARDKIVSQIGPFKGLLRRDEMKRLREQETDVSEPEGVMALPGSAEEPDLKQFERYMESYWQPLVRQVSREISALEMNNELPLGEIAAQDIVDEVIVRAHERFQDRPAGVSLEIWLYQLAREILKERREQLQAEMPMSSVPNRSMKETLPPPPPPNPLTDDEQVLVDLLEPEPEPLPGDEIPDQAEPVDPIEIARHEELRRALHKTISQMPAIWRETLWLHYLDGFDLSEIAALQQLDEEQVRKNLHQAVTRLRDAMYSWRDWQGQMQDENHFRDQTEPRSET